MRLALRNELEKLTVDRLKNLAKDVGARLTGAGKKGEVVERLLTLSVIGSLGKRIADVSEVTLSYITEEVKAELLKLPPLDEISDWTKSLKSLQQFHFVNLFLYLVESRDKTFDQQSMRAFKSLKAFKFYADGYVQNMWLHKVPDSDLLVMRAFCFHSLTADPALKVFIILSGSSGDVYSAHCNCVAGLGASCNHIAAALFALEDAVKRGRSELPIQPSRTSLPMQWNQPPKKVIQATPLQDIQFVKAAYGKVSQDSQHKLSVHAFDPRAPQDREINTGKLNTLLSALSNSFPNSGLLQFWRDGPRTVSPVNCISALITEEIQGLLLFDEARAMAFDLSSPELDAPALLERKEMLDAMVISNELAYKVEELTRGQAENRLWHDLRNGHLTSSRFGKVLHRRNSTASTCLVTEIMGYKPHFSTAAMRWGTNNESHARTAYLHHKTAARNPVIYQESGLHLYPSASYLGASSDGLLTDPSIDGIPIGCLEIKCPFSLHGQSLLELTPEEIATRFNDFCLEKLDNGSVHLKRNHNFYAQVQGEMHIIGVEWCDFVVYTPRGIFVERIVHDGMYWEETLLPQLQNFYRDHVIPELCTAAIYRQMHAFSVKSQYCADLQHEP